MRWVGEDALTGGSQGNVGEETEKPRPASLYDEEFADAHFFDGNVGMETNF
jgi:hypothetical protein